MRAISRAPVSGKSPRQMISSSCVRTAGVRSTGKSAAVFLSRVSAGVASQVASVASASRCPGALRSAPSAAAGVPVCRSVVASLRACGLRSQPVAGASSPVALLGRLLRRGMSASVASVGTVPCVKASRSHVALSRRCVRSVASSPRQVLHPAFERLAEAARDSSSRRLSRRFAGPPSHGSRAVHEPVACVPRNSRVAFLPVASLRSGQARPVASPIESAARTWRYH